MLAITVGWFRTKRFNGAIEQPLVSVSIVIAVRNEETNLLKLLKCLVNQDYPASNFEVIIVDDHSEDETRKVIENFILLNSSINIRLLEAAGEGKKQALKQGIDVASGELIVTTDGDCEMGIQWLNKLVAFFQATKSPVIIAPVIYHKTDRLIENIFSLEFMSLVASGAGSTGIGMPFMANGANLAFSQEVFSSMKSKDGEQYASGDDVFLIHKVMKTKGSGHICFIRDPEAIVHTHAPGTVSDFLNQRIRWASKAKGYKSAWALIVAFTVFCFNLMLVTTFLAGFIQTWMVIIFGLFVIFKLLIDIPLLYEFTGFVNRRKLMFFLPVLEFIYPFYIVISSLIGLFFQYEWKGRKSLR